MRIIRSAGNSRGKLQRVRTQKPTGTIMEDSNDSD